MEKIKKAVTKVFNNYANFKGRAGREEFWYYFIAMVVASIVTSILDAVIGFGIFGLLLSLGTIVPSIAVSVRRLHDTNRSGWWVLINLIPFLGWIVALVLMALKGDHGHNQYGEVNHL